MSVRVETLGTLAVRQDGRLLHEVPRKPVQAALLVYLAVERSTTRDEVQALLWPDSSQERARRSLNNTLYELRSLLGAESIRGSGDVLEAAEWLVTDVGEHEAAAASGRLSEALGLYRAPFLDGHHLAATAGFEQWVDRMRARVAERQRSIRKKLVTRLVDEGRTAEALGEARAWTEQFPLDEEAHYWTIRLLGALGRRAEAVRVFDALRTRIEDALGAEPDPKLVDAVERVRAGSEVEPHRWDPAAAPGSPEESPPATVAATDPSPEPASTLGAPAEEASTSSNSPDTVWRPEPGWARKLVAVLGLYAVPAAGLLQVLDYLIDYVGVPRSFLPAAMVLIACGAPVVAVTAFLESQPVLRRDLRGFRFLVARWFNWRNAVLGGLAAAAAWTAAVIGWNLADGFADDASVVVVPFHTSSSTEEERRMADELADEVTRELASWEAMRAIPTVSLEGPMFDLGLRDPTIERVDDGLALAQALEARRLAALTVRVRGDSARVSATLMDSRTGRPVRPPIEAEGPVHDALALAATVAHGVLGFDTLEIAPGQVRRGTSHREALLADVRGMRALGQWQLVDAVDAFREAVAHDPSFSLGHLHLAQSLYWHSARSTQRLGQIGPEIARASARAMETSVTLPSRERSRVEAFHHFQAGDLEQARSLYRELLSTAPTDVYALLMLGSVEYRDRGLDVEAGAERPRADWNVARRAFSEALRLQPAFDLGYGHLFDIESEIERVANRRSCTGFARPEAVGRAVWDATPIPPSESRSFCPVVLDSIVWVARDTLDRLDPAVIEAGAERTLRESLRQLRRWAAYDPDAPMPRERMATVWLRLRERLAVAPPDELDALADSAQRHARAALELRSDTLASDLATLSGLLLATGQRDEAMEWSRAALRRHDAAGDVAGYPRAAANVLLSTGRPEDAMPIVTRAMTTTFIRDSVDGSFIPYGQADEIIARIRVLAASGVGGEPLLRELDALERAWSGSRITDHQRVLLRRSATVLLAPALVLEPGAMERWDAATPSSDPLWEALVRADRDPGGARAALDRALASRTAVLSDPTETYLEAVAAERIGDRETALALYSRLDSIPLHPDRLDHGWGFRTLSYLARGRLYESAGDRSRAEAHYRLFLDSTVGSDGLTREARRRVEELAGSFGRPLPSN